MVEAGGTGEFTNEAVGSCETICVGVLLRVVEILGEEGEPVKVAGGVVISAFSLASESAFFMGLDSVVI